MFALRSGSAKPSHMRIRLYPSTVGLLEATADTLPSNPALRSGYSKPPQWDPTGNCHRTYYGRAPQSHRSEIQREGNQVMTQRYHRTYYGRAPQSHRSEIQRASNYQSLSS